MPVVIDQFEVLDAPPAAARGAGGADAAAASPAASTLPQPEDLRRLLAEMGERELRRFSH